jgi:hypothetical protein
MWTNSHWIWKKVHETSSEIIGIIHRKGRMVSAQHFVDSQLEEFKEPFMRIREMRTHKKITVLGYPDIIRAVNLEGCMERDHHFCHSREGKVKGGSSENL